MLPANPVAFDVSTAEKIPSAEQVWKRNLKNFMYSSVASLIYTKDLVLGNEDFTLFLLPEENFVPHFRFGG